MKYRKRIGSEGEAFASILLEEEGYQIMNRNYQTCLGEIDIIARKNGILHFIEVKTRTNITYGYPAEAVNTEKQNRIKRVAEQYLNSRKLRWDDISFDVMEISVNFIRNCM